MAVVDNKVL